MRDINDDDVLVGSLSDHPAWTKLCERADYEIEKRISAFAQFAIGGCDTSEMKEKADWTRGFISGVRWICNHPRNIRGKIDQQYGG